MPQAHGSKEHTNALRNGIRRTRINLGHRGSRLRDDEAATARRRARQGDQEFQTRRESAERDRRLAWRAEEERRDRRGLRARVEVEQVSASAGELGRAAKALRSKFLP